MNPAAHRLPRAAVALAAMLALVPAARAAAEEAAPPADAPRSIAEAVGLEQAARSEWARLIQTMHQVARNLESSDPDAAHTIAAAAEKAQQAFIAEDMAKVIQFLEEGLIVPADAMQAEVIRKLKEVLEALRSGSLHLDERLQRLAEWKKHLAALENIVRRQRALEQQSRDVAFGKDLAGTLSDLARQVGDLARQERELAAETGKLPDGEKADGVAAAIDKALGAPPGGKNSVGRAAEHMAKAAEGLREPNKAAALGEEKKAVAELEGAARELADRMAAIQKAAQDPQFPDQTGKQSDLAKETGQLASNMKGGRQGESSSSQSSPSESGASPGQPSVQKASEHQQQAAGQLGRQQAASANREQNEALRNLQEARQSLSDAIAKDQEALQQESLARIEAMLRKILTAQKQVSADTQAAYARRKAEGEYERTEKIRLAELAAGEGQLAEETAKVLRVLAEEGTTVVFPVVLKEIREDLVKVQELLAALQAGPLAQGIQRQIEERLQELIDALATELARRQEENQQGGGRGGQGRQPLVPPLAELKMLRTLQTQINKRTALLDETKRSGQVPAETIDVQHKVLADRQGAVGKMTRDLAETLRRREE